MIKNETDFVKELTTKIKEHRFKYKLSQRNFAEKIGMKQQHLSRLEKGDETPHPKTLFKILNELKMELKIEKVEEI